MIIDPSEIFDNKVLVLNKNPIIETLDVGPAKVTVIDNFYEDVDGVIAQIPKMPVSLVWDQEGNNETFFDGRRVYRSNMEGSIIPYAFDHTLPNLVSSIVDFPVDRIRSSKEFIVNCFRFTDEFDSVFKTHWYGPHRDRHDYGPESTGMIAIVVFLNEHYEEGEGMNFYEVPDDFVLTIRERKDEVKQIHSVQGKKNRAVLFDSQFPHGQHTPTNQFKNEMRYTQVIFVPLY